jgi:hypothetical protein
VSVGISTEAGRLTTLPSLSSLYEVDPVITFVFHLFPETCWLTHLEPPISPQHIGESPNGGPTTKHRLAKSCIFRVVPP